LQGGYVVGETGYGLELDGFKGCARDLSFGGVLRGVEEAAEGTGNLLGKHQAEFGGELMLVGDPKLVGGGAQIEDGVTPHGGRGETGDERQQRLPFEGAVVGVFNRGWDGIEERHAQ
jgi:hypothetical protein